MSQQSSGLSADTQALMAFESTKKSAGVAYLLWFFTAVSAGTASMRVGQALRWAS